MEKLKNKTIVEEIEKKISSVQEKIDTNKMKLKDTNYNSKVKINDVKAILSELYGELAAYIDCKGMLERSIK